MTITIVLSYYLIVIVLSDGRDPGQVVRSDRLGAQSNPYSPNQIPKTIVPVALPLGLTPENFDKGRRDLEDIKDKKGIEEVNDKKAATRAWEKNDMLTRMDG